MREITGQNFGLLIAYVLPGFVVLCGLGQVLPFVEAWLGGPGGPDQAVTVGGFLYVSLGSVGAGMVVSTIRWAIVDRLHHATGLRAPVWDDSRLQRNLDAFDYLVEVTYRYYQHYANTLVAVLIAYVAWRLNTASVGGWLAYDAAFIAFQALYLAGSRDTLQKYYSRSARLLARAQGTDPMTNGNDHGGGHGTKSVSKPAPQPVPGTAKSSATSSVKRQPRPKDPKPRG